MSQNYIIEVREQAAGIVVRDGQKYRFFAASHAFNPLEGRLFKNPREAERAATHHLSTLRRIASDSLSTARHSEGSALPMNKGARSGDASRAPRAPPLLPVPRPGRFTPATRCVSQIPSNRLVDR